ncbi:MAG: PadR family transcriptional regulator [Gemmatimonadota bacterium]|nr:PadR family transcriptional regulator [Gemmatimonadota bacterium]
MSEESLELLKGTLDVLVLKTLSWGAMHGYGISRWIRSRTHGELGVDDAALYQALHRMERRGWLEAEWGRSENNRRAKFYSLTKKGRNELGRQTREVRRYVKALSLVLDARSLGAS